MSYTTEIAKKMLPNVVRKDSKRIDISPLLLRDLIIEAEVNEWMSESELPLLFGSLLNRSHD